VEEILNTDDFGAWEDATRATLGVHQSSLHSPSASFRARYRFGHAGPLQLLHLQGSGELELDREQLGRPVLWIPLQGLCQERVNGEPLVVSPGKALLIRPGDHLLGRTATDLEGLSLLLPASRLSGRPATPRGSDRPAALLGAAEDQRRLAAAAVRLLRAVERRDPCRAIAARQLLDQIEALTAKQLPAARPRLAQRRRWRLVVEASRWMEDRLDQPFGLAELAVALAVPSRTLQDSFARELGRSPLAQARLLRLRALRRCLQDHHCDHLSIGALMGRCGLLACGATARAYAACYGELPRLTRRRQLGFPAGDVLPRGETGRDHENSAL